ncbi:MAG: hypothetical protein BWY11_00170 [Firmicutes bacterium ADurb.Bin182]|nr:MAG: hypothetical protein BWY11_00170 [Firmicutes bacterium ADurb.Bin182]
MDQTKYLSFSGKNEYIVSGGQVEEYGIGSLLFAFLDVDWMKLHDEANDLNRKCYIENIDRETYFNVHDESRSYMIAATYYKLLMKNLNALHPFLGQIIDEKLCDAVYSVLPENYDLVHDVTFDLFRNYPSTPESVERMELFAESSGDAFSSPVKDWSLVEATNAFSVHLIELMENMLAFKADMLEMMAFSLDKDSEFADMKPPQRFYLMQVSCFEALVRTERLIVKNKLLGAEQRILREGEFKYPEEKITPEFIAELKRCTFFAHMFYTSEDVRALVFAEFRHMCMNELAVRKCEYCGRYFLPFSSASLYCDRVVENSEGKTCKEVAPTEKYFNKRNADAARKLYSRLRNTYHMRCERAPQVYPHEEYYAWMDNAKGLLKEVDAGSLSVEEFEQRVVLERTR